MFRYSRLCGTVSDAVDAVKLEIPKGAKLLKFKMSEYLKNIVKVTFQKFETLSLGITKCHGGRGVEGIKKQSRRRMGGIKQGKSDIYRMLNCVQPQSLNLF